MSSISRKHPYARRGEVEQQPLEKTRDGLLRVAVNNVEAAVARMHVEDASNVIDATPFFRSKLPTNQLPTDAQIISLADHARSQAIAADEATTTAIEDAQRAGNDAVYDRNILTEPMAQTGANVSYIEKLAAAVKGEAESVSDMKSALDKLDEAA